MATDHHTSIRLMPTSIRSLQWLCKQPAKVSAGLLYSSLSLLTLLPIHSASAFDYTLNVSAGTEYDDNATRSPSEFAREEIETSLGGDLGVTHTSEPLDIDLRYRAAYHDYKNGDIETNNEITGSSDVMWKIVDQRLEWNFNHYIAEVLANNSAVDTPDNRETRQTFTTGPAITARLSSVDNLLINATYTVVKQDDSANEVGLERTNIDSDRGQAGVTWRHALSRTSDFDIGASLSQTEFDNNSPDFEYQQVFVGYNVRLASGSYGIQLGVNESQRENEDDQDGLYTSINFTRNFSAHTLALSAVRQLTDSSTGLGNGLGNGFGTGLGTGLDSPVNSNFGETSTVERTNVGINYSYSNLCSSCNLQLTYSFDDEDFLTDGQPTTQIFRDSKEHRLSASLEYRNNSRLTSSFSAGYGQTKFTAGDRTDDLFEFQFNLNWRAAEKLTINFATAYDSRETELNQPADLDYDAFSVGVSAIYNIH